MIKMDKKTVANAFKQIASGSDIPAPAKLLNGISEARAAVRLPGFPYSIAENLWHAVFWQDIWLNRVQGRKAKTFIEDWQTPSVGEFKQLRARFIENEARALKLLCVAKFNHSMKSEPVALQMLMAMAVHDAYHLGQINLLKRVQRATK